MTEPLNTEDFAKANAKLPFSIDKISFIGWMGDLDLENEVETLRYLSITLKTLKEELIKPEDRLFFLQKLSELVEQLSQQLQETYKNSCFPFSKQNNNKLELSVSCATEIAKNYALICEDKDFMFTDVFSREQKALVIYRGIRAQANVLLYQSLLYRKADEGFWNLCFLYYLFAKQNDVLDFELESENASFMRVFKQVLLFELSNVRQFNTEELFAVFHLLNKFSDHVVLRSKVPDKKFRGIPCINLRLDAPPSMLKEGAEQEHPYLFYISSLNVIKQLLELTGNKNTKEFCNKSTLLRLIKTLTMNYQRDSERELTDERLFACIGFDKVKKYVLGTERIKNKKNNLVAGEIRDLDFEIQEIETSRNKANFLRAERAADLGLLTDSVILEDIKRFDIWPGGKEKAEQESKNPVINTDLIDKSYSGFGVRLNAVATKVGDIIGLTMFDTLMVTVVRRIVQLQRNELQVGVEVLGNNPEILHLGDIRNKNALTALYLKGDDGVDSIIIGSNEYQNEDFLFFDNNARFRVEKQLYMSSTIRHLKVKDENNL